MRIYRNKQGFTLLELLLVLVIITAIILIAGRYYQQATEASKVSDATSKVRRIIEASYEWEKVNKSFNGINTDVLITQNLLSESDVAGPWGDSLNLTGTSNTQIQIMIPKVPAKACLAIQDTLNNQNMIVSCGSAMPGQETTATVIYPADAI